jgi:hypothetical protein
MLGRLVAGAGHVRPDGFAFVSFDCELRFADLLSVLIIERGVRAGLHDPLEAIPPAHRFGEPFPKQDR